MTSWWNSLCPTKASHSWSTVASHHESVNKKLDNTYRSFWLQLFANTWYLVMSFKDTTASSLQTKLLYQKLKMALMVNELGLRNRKKCWLNSSLCIKMFTVSTNYQLCYSMYNNLQFLRSSKLEHDFIIQLFGVDMSYKSCKKQTYDIQL